MTAQPYQHLQTFGRGAHAALALHCTLSHGGAWRLLAEALNDVVTLRAPDLPGHGQSDDWSGAGELHDLCASSAAQLLTRPMTVIGHSFGATVALRLAIEHPQNVQRLCLVEPVLFAAVKEDDPAVFAAHRRDATPVFDAIEAKDLETAARLFNQTWGMGIAWDAMPDRIRTYIIERMHLIAAQEAVLYQDSAGLLAPESLSRLKMPVLLVEGDQSPAIVPAIHHALVRRLPQARREVVTGAGHMAPLTHAKPVASILRSFLEVV